jgi:hypothetical protein
MASSSKQVVTAAQAMALQIGGQSIKTPEAMVLAIKQLPTKGERMATMQKVGLYLLKSNQHVENYIISLMDDTMKALSGDFEDEAERKELLDSLGELPEVAEKAKEKRDKRGKAYIRIEKVFTSQRGKHLLEWMKEEWGQTGQGMLNTLSGICETWKGDAVRVVSALNAALVYRLVNNPTRLGKRWTTADVNLVRDWVKKEQEPYTWGEHLIIVKGLKRGELGQLVEDDGIVTLQALFDDDPKPLPETVPEELAQEGAPEEPEEAID